MKMKLKTSKSVAKRFKITASGKIKRHRAGRGHLLAKKRRARKRTLRRPDLVAGKEKQEMIKYLLPYR
ncbi:MAG: 50S ribosomal protein L35 [Candidatus Omnitrophota bacterium]